MLYAAAGSALGVGVLWMPGRLMHDHTLHMPLCLVQMIIAKDGVSGLFGRGLTTKLISNGIQVCYDGGRER